MATCGYHLTAKAVSFGKGQSAVHTAAYNAREQLQHEREGRTTSDYSRFGATLFSGIFAPPNAPAWAHDREQLWNRAEAAERQWNGQPARNIDLAFPHQLNPQQREWLVKDFVREQFVRQGMIADVNIHAPHAGRDGRNYHAHLLLTMRPLDGETFAKSKNRDWNRAETLERWKERWAEMGARALERAGYQQEADRWRHGHQTLAEQRAAALARGDAEYAEAVNREPTTHRGPHVDAIERKGRDTERGNAYRDTIDRNATLAAMQADLAEIEKQIAAEQQRQTEAAQLKGVARDIWEAREHSDDARSFTAALQEHDILIARATKEDAEQSRAANREANEHGRWVPVLREGEYVAVSRHGDVYRLTEKVAGASFAETEQFMSALDAHPVESVAGTREIMQHMREAALMARATQRASGAPEYSGRDDAAQFGQAQLGRVLGQTLDYFANIAEEAIGMLGDMVSPTEMTKERVDAIVHAREQTAEEFKIDLARFKSDEDYRRQVEAHHAQKVAEEQRRDYEQQREREGERS